MKTYTQIFSLLVVTNCCYAQTPYVFTDFPLNDEGNIHDMHPENFCVYNGRLIFSAYGKNFGAELWSTDGTSAGTYMIKDINPTAPGSFGGGSNPGGFTEIDEKLIFVATTDELGRELWITDGTKSNTKILKDIFTGPGPSNPGGFTRLGNKILFRAKTSSTNNELWVTDGTASGTMLLKDIRPGDAGSDPNLFTLFNGKVYFAANDGVNGTELWVSDGTTPGTYMVKDIDSGRRDSNPASFTVLSGKIYFYAKTVKYGSELWTTDGTANGTHMVKDIYPGYENGVISHSTNPIPERFAVYNNKLYFSANDSINGYELWCSDGTNPGTYMVKDINKGIESSQSVHQYAVYKNKLYFTAYDGMHGSELWVTDGSNAGTQLVVDLSPGSSYSVPSYFIMFDDHLYYRGRKSTDQFNFQLIQTDGTAAGTKVMNNPAEKWHEPLLATREFIVYDSALYFAASYDDHGNELWSFSDTTGRSISPRGEENNDSINNNTHLSISLYPNPNDGRFTLECSSDYFIGSTALIIDMLGREVSQRSIDSVKTKIEVSNLAQGAYKAVIHLDKKTYSKTFVKFE